jgi:hypothetical protein
MKRLALIIAAALAGIALAVVLAASGSAQQPGEADDQARRTSGY